MITLVVNGRPSRNMQIIKPAVNGTLYFRNFGNVSSIPLATVSTCPNWNLKNVVPLTVIIHKIEHLYELYNVYDIVCLNIKNIYLISDGKKVAIGCFHQKWNLHIMNFKNAFAGRFKIHHSWFMIEPFHAERIQTVITFFIVFPK